LFENLNPDKTKKAYGLPSKVLVVAGGIYSDNLRDKTTMGEDSVIQSIISGLRTAERGIKDSTLNNWENFLRGLNDSEIGNLEAILDSYTPEGRAAYAKSQANSPQAINKKTDRATDNWLKTGALKLNEQALDKEKLQTEYNKFIKTQQGQTAKNLADTIIKNKGSVSKAGVNESLGNADASLAASGILLGPFLTHLAQQGMGLTPSLATNVFSFLVGVFGGGAVGLGLDYLRHKQGERQQGK
jgi:hypothetical protein